jgi:GT2 family glycosyltransferase
MDADVTVVIGNHQGETVLDECLASVAMQARPVREVIVADGASTDRSRSIAERHGALFLPFPNLGLGYLYNRGVEAARAEYILLLNNDVALDVRCVQLLTEQLDADQTRFAADPTQFDWTANHVIHARTTVGPGRLTREFIPGLHLDPVVPANTVVPTVSANGAAMLVRRSMFLELGGFDETFFMEWEDLDLCWRAWLRGWSSVYVPEATLRHRVGAVTSDAVAPRRSTSSHHNLMRFALKCLPATTAAKVLLGELLRLPAHPRTIGAGSVRVAAELTDIVRLRRSQKRRGPLVTDVIATPETGR